jgi:hypothetical protein
MQRHLQDYLPDAVKHLSERKSRHVHQTVSNEEQYYTDSDEESVTNSDESSCDSYHPENMSTLDMDTLPSIKLRGRFTCNIRIDRMKRRHVTHQWTSYKKRNLRFYNPSSLIGKCLSDFHIKYCSQYRKAFREVLSFECFTRATIDGVLYRAIPNWYGKAWYDWAVVKFPKMNASRNRKVGPADKVQCIGRIITFFRHCDIGVPTFKYAEENDLSWEEIASSPKDETIYVMMHCQDREFSYSDLQSMFIYKFKMTSLTSLYVLPLSSIVGPLAVVPDMIEYNEASTTHFMAVLPRHKQAPFFTQYIHSDDTDFDFDPDAAWDDDEEEEEEEEEQESEIEFEYEIAQDEEEYSSDEEYDTEGEEQYFDDEEDEDDEEETDDDNDM